MGIFNKKDDIIKKPQAVITSAPETPETPGEQRFAEELSQATSVDNTTTPSVEYREVPVCMSQEQINNLVIENNIMLKQIISEMD